MIEYKAGLRLISNDNTKGVIIKILSIGKFIREPNIIIEWVSPELIGVVALDLKKKSSTSKVLYTQSMLDEAFSEGIIKIDKQYYRNKKLNELGI
jgi:hypothetical protein